MLIHITFHNNHGYSHNFPLQGAVPPATLLGGGLPPLTPAEETKPPPRIPGRLERYTIITDVGAAGVILQLPRKIPAESTY